MSTQETVSSNVNMLFSAIKKKDLASLTSLVNTGADVNAKNEQQQTLLMLSVIPDFKNSNVIDLLNTQTENNDMKIISFLIQKGANIHAQDQLGNTALIYAVEVQNIDAIKLLIKYGANVNATNKKQQHALFFAPTFEKSSMYSIMRLLLDSGSDVNKHDEEGETVLMKLINEGMPFSDKNCIQLLLDRKADVNKVNNNKENALNIIAHQEMDENTLYIMKMLIAKGIDVNNQDHEGSTPFMTFIVSNNNFTSKVCKELLMTSDIDTTIENKMLLNVMDYVWEKSHLLDMEVVEALDKKGIQKIPRFGVNINRKGTMTDLITGEDKTLHAAEYLKESHLNVVVMYNKNDLFFTTSTILKFQLDNKDNIVYGCPTADSFEGMNRGIKYFNLRSIGLHLDHQFCDMNAFYQNIDAQLFIIYGLNRSFPSFASVAIADDNNPESVMSGLHCQSGQHSNVSNLLIAYPALKDNQLVLKESLTPLNLGGKSSKKKQRRQTKKKGHRKKNAVSRRSNRYSKR